MRTRENLYLPNNFKSHLDEKLELACVRGLCEILPLKALKRLSKEADREAEFLAAFTQVSKQEMSKQ